MKQHKKAISKLNELLTKNVDAQKGFEKVMHATDNIYLTELFSNFALQHQDFGANIKKEIIKLDGEVDADGSMIGAAHRVWIDVKQVFSMDDNEALLECCLAGERSCLEEYEDVAKDHTFPMSTRNMLSEQHSAVQKMLSNIKREEAIRD